MQYISNKQYILLCA